jgi:hypothetical protein
VVKRWTALSLAALLRLAYDSNDKSDAHGAAARVDVSYMQLLASKHTTCKPMLDDDGDDDG